MEFSDNTGNDSIMKITHLFIFLGLIFISHNQELLSQNYDFSSIDQMLEDSSSLYLDRIYVEVFQNNLSIYKFQKGQIKYNAPRLGQGSATKWISSGIMLKLAEKGWWSLDDSIGKYLPIFSDYGKGHITLRQSYSMSSGMYNPGNSSDYHKDPTLTLEQSVDSIAKHVEILYPAGEMIGYDGTMMHVWGRAAEVIDENKGFNRSWREIAREEFFSPLEMDSTDYTDFLPNPAVAGGIETTPHDYLNFLHMLANIGEFKGRKILNPGSVQEMFTDQTSSAPIFDSYWPPNHPDFPNNVDTMKYTFGAWWSELDENGKITVITSPGAFGNYPFVDRCRNIYGTFFCYIHPFKGGGQNVMNTFLRFLKILRDSIQPNCNLDLSNTEILNEVLSLQLYPNPAKDEVIINSTHLLSSYRIFNSSGALVQSNNHLNKSHLSLNLSRLKPGIYLVQALTNNNKMTTKRLIIKN